ncbi:uncharacterized protein LOC123383153 [Felis catus]|uniref:uncharacterized protein LOC123383153 n=1 Tax=Felis catus TaxID=9685 RepID=UPI001D19AA09|nr:uncharacterized protein LOC123383153 [Felis catus]
MRPLTSLYISLGCVRFSGGRFPGVELLSRNFKSFIIIDVVTQLSQTSITICSSSNNAGDSPWLFITANKPVPAAVARPPPPPPPHPQFRCPWFLLPEINRPLKADDTSAAGRSEGQRWTNATSLRVCHSRHFVSSRRYFIISHHHKKAVSNLEFVKRCSPFWQFLALKVYVVTQSILAENRHLRSIPEKVKSSCPWKKCHNLRTRLRTRLSVGSPRPSLLCLLLQVQAGLIIHGSCVP